MQHRSSAVQGVVFGGLMAALVVVFALIPGLAVLMPLPLVLVFLRHGGRVAAMTALVSVIMTTLFSGVVQGLLIIPAGIMPGLIFGYGFRRRWKPLSIGLSALAVSFVGFAISYVLLRLAVYGGQDPIEMAVQEGPARQLWEMIFDAYEQAAAQYTPATPEQAQALENFRQMIGEMRANPAAIAWVLLPAAVFLGGAFSTWLNWSLCRWTLPRFGYEIPEPMPFAEFRLPVWLVWVYGILMFLAPYALSGPTIIGATWWVKLLINLVSTLGWIFALAGVAVAYGFLVRRQNLRPVMAALIVVASFLLFGQLAMPIYIILAMWDAIFDFRGLGHGLWKPPEEST